MIICNKGIRIPTICYRKLSCSVFAFGLRHSRELVDFADIEAEFFGYALAVFGVRFQKKRGLTVLDTFLRLRERSADIVY